MTKCLQMSESMIEFFNAFTLGVGATAPPSTLRRPPAPTLPASTAHPRRPACCNPAGAPPPYSSPLAPTRSPAAPPGRWPRSSAAPSPCRCGCPALGPLHLPRAGRIPALACRAASRPGTAGRRAHRAPHHLILQHQLRPGQLLGLHKRIGLRLQQLIGGSYPSRNCSIPNSVCSPRNVRGGGSPGDSGHQQTPIATPAAHVSRIPPQHGDSDDWKEPGSVPPHYCSCPSLRKRGPRIYLRGPVHLPQQHPKLFLGG